LPSEIFVCGTLLQPAGLYILVGEKVSRISMSRTSNVCRHHPSYQKKLCARNKEYNNCYGRLPRNRHRSWRSCRS